MDIKDLDGWKHDVEKIQQDNFEFVTVTSHDLLEIIDLARKALDKES